MSSISLDFHCFILATSILLFGRKEFFFIFAVKAVLDTAKHIFLMVLKLGGTVKLRSTVLTLKLAVLVVPSNVILKVSLCDELLIADFTGIITLTEVALQVNVKVTLLCELIATEMALIGFYTEVLSNMNLQS